MNTCAFLLRCPLLLKLVNVTVAEVVCVSYKLLAVEAGHHSMLESLFVAEKLRKNGTQLQVVLA